MRKLKLGILGTADIAYRRFLPALNKNEAFEFAGIASRTREKALSFVREFGGKDYNSYEQLLSDKNIDAVYIPLPPALHFQWAKLALECGKHVFLEKPSTTNYDHTLQLVNLAKQKNLSLSENYMFLYHRQVTAIQDLLAKNEIGRLRLIRCAFGFPMRAKDDFRYNAVLGGGAILDCGGYPVRLATLFLGKTVHVASSSLCHSDEFGVDMYGSASIENASGCVVQISFGMDNFYKCELELWGSKGYVKAPRIFTAPPGYAAPIIIETAEGARTIEVQDDQFANSIEAFYDAVQNAGVREDLYSQLLLQMKLVAHIKEGAKA